MEPEGHAMISLYHVETLEWIEPRHHLPDDDTMVLIYAPRRSEPVWFGWHEDSGWCSGTGIWYDEGDVTAWAEMPRGSQS